MSDRLEGRVCRRAICTATDPEVRAFVVANAAPARPTLLPELTLLTATEVTPLWHATEAWLARRGVPPPFWAFAWSGGQAVARLLLDRPELVRGKRVLDFACGGGLVAIAAALSGASRVLAIDIDPFAIAATELNAERNGVIVEVKLGDGANEPLDDVDVVVAGDVCYESDFAKSALEWLRGAAALGKATLLGDPGRSYFRPEGLCEVARYQVPTTRELEASDVRDTRVWSVEPCRPI